MIACSPLSPPTDQYFLWYLTLLPLIVPHLQMSVWRGGVLAGMWAAAQVRLGGGGREKGVRIGHAHTDCGRIIDKFSE